MSRTRRRYAYRRSRRWNPGRRRRNCGGSMRNPKSYSIMGARGRARFRKEIIWKMAGPGFTRHGSRGAFRRRRNPGGTFLRDGTSVHVDGSSVTVHGPYGQIHEYEDVPARDLAKLRRCTTHGQCISTVGRHSMLRSANPRRGRGGRRMSRRRNYSRTVTFRRPRRHRVKFRHRHATARTRARRRRAGKALARRYGFRRKHRGRRHARR